MVPYFPDRVQQVLQAVNSGAVPNASLQSPSAVAVRLHVTRVLSGTFVIEVSGLGARIHVRINLCGTLLSSVDRHVSRSAVKHSREPCVKTRLVLGACCPLHATICICGQWLA